MNITEAKQIAASLKNHKAKNSPYVQIREIEPGPMAEFHHWAEGKLCEGAFLFSNAHEKKLWITLIDWQKNGNIYVIIFPEKSENGPLIEIHNVIEESGKKLLTWKYRPIKHDGKNIDRKKIFLANIPEEIKIEIPDELHTTIKFLDKLFLITETRIKADELST